MSSKSKKKPQKWSRTAQINADLLVFFWALVSQTDRETAQAVVNEVQNVNESLRAGLINLNMIHKQLVEEYDIHTDWARRDRG